MRPLIAVPSVSLLVYRAWSRKSLTPLGIIVAAATGIVHVVHPWSVPFALLVVFFVSGTAVTKVKHDVKARLTLSASGSSSGEGRRTHIQVLANSLVASVLTLLHTWQLANRQRGGSGRECWSWGGDLLVVGIVANYAAVTADTFSSELGILSKSPPRLITSLTLRQVPPGTNGGVTLYGILAGFFGSFTIALTSALLLPFCGTHTSASSAQVELPGLQGGKAWDVKERVIWIIAVTVWGGLGSLLDSFLGGWLQASVVDVRTGKIVEGVGGKKVLICPTRPSSMETSNTAEIRTPPLESVGNVEHPSNDDDRSLRQRLRKNSEQQSPALGFAKDSPHDGKPSRKIESGVELLDNNAVNFLMAFTMSVGGILTAAWYWGIPLDGVMGS